MKKKTKEYWIDISTLDYAVYFSCHKPLQQHGSLCGPFKNRSAAKKAAASIMRAYIGEYKSMLDDILNCKELDFEERPE